MTWDLILSLVHKSGTTASGCFLFIWASVTLHVCRTQLRKRAGILAFPSCMISFTKKYHITNRMQVKKSFMQLFCVKKSGGKISKITAFLTSASKLAVFLKLTFTRHRCLPVRGDSKPTRWNPSNTLRTLKESRLFSASACPFFERFCALLPENCDLESCKIPY